MKLPDWRLIRIAEIKQLKVLDKQFSGGRLSIPARTRNGVRYSSEYHSRLNLMYGGIIRT